jgi:hypothetical protein
MFDDIDRAYFLRRAREARDRAASLGDPRSAIAHLDIADEHERRAMRVGTAAERCQPRFIRTLREPAEAYLIA